MHSAQAGHTHVLAVVLSLELCHTYAERWLDPFLACKDRFGVPHAWASRSSNLKFEMPWLWVLGSLYRPSFCACQKMHFEGRNPTTPHRYEPTGDKTFPQTRDTQDLRSGWGPEAASPNPAPVLTLLRRVLSCSLLIHQFTPPAQLNLQGQRFVTCNTTWLSLHSKGVKVESSFRVLSFAVESGRVKLQNQQNTSSAIALSTVFA